MKKEINLLSRIKNLEKACISLASGQSAILDELLELQEDISKIFTELKLNNLAINDRE